VLRNCRLPTRYRLLLPVKAAKPWPLDFNLAAVEADLALRFPPAVRPPVTTSRMPWTTDCLRIAIHHLAKGLHAGSQTNQLEARRNLRQGLKLQRSRRNRSRCSKLVHGVAFLCGITTPSLAAQGEQRRFSYFNIERDNSRTGDATAKRKPGPKPKPKPQPSRQLHAELTKLRSENAALRMQLAQPQRQRAAGAPSLEMRILQDEIRSCNHRPTRAKTSLRCSSNSRRRAPVFIT